MSQQVPESGDIIDRLVTYISRYSLHLVGIVTPFGRPAPSRLPPLVIGCNPCPKYALDYRNRESMLYPGVVWLL
jgi:hypothetical protein